MMTLDQSRKKLTVWRTALMTLLLMLNCASLASCAPQIRHVDTSCSWTQNGTASERDTLTTRRWMISYQTARNKICPPAAPGITLDPTAGAQTVK